MFLCPESFNWDRDAIGFYKDHETAFFAAAVLYLPCIFGIQHLMRDRPAFDLGGAKTRLPVNIIFWWEAALALFSIIGALNTVPLLLEHIVAHSGLIGSICAPTASDIGNDPRAFWAFLFSVSKVFEFGDTLFVVLRKRKLIFLQYYHHLATMLYCWLGMLNVTPLNNTAWYYGVLNYLVHSIMYTWYTASRTGWRSPKWMMVGITMLQLSQMFLGIAVTFVASGAPGTACGTWRRDSPYTNYMAIAMYSSYVALFGHLFASKYLYGKKKGARGKKEL